MPPQAEIQIAVRAGTAEPPAMDLSPGQAVGPLSIGRFGTWRIVAPGVLEEHGFLYFNGAELFLQSTDPHTPLLANGSPIPMDWTAIYAPCEITVGGARLFFGSPQATTDAPRAPAAARPEPQAGRGQFAPRVQGNDNEDETRVAPIEQLAAVRASRGAAALKSAQPQLGAPSFGAPPVDAPPPIPMGTPSFGPVPFEVPAPGSAAPGSAAAPVTMGGDPPYPPAQPVVFPGPAAAPDAPPAPPAKPSWIAARWREASGPKKALMVLMAPLIWAVWVIFTDKPPPPPPPKPAASASTQPSAVPSASAPAADTQAQAAAQPPAATAASGSPSAKATAGSPATTGAKTPQREATDAVAAGAFDRAATLYEELARAHPEVPAYAEAARIMKAKAGKR